MKIKAKLRLGIGLLFTMIALLIILSSVNINKLAKDTKNILVANYNTLDYSRKMLIALDRGISIEVNKKMFEANLTKQLNNITETGEKELTEKLSSHFTNLVQSSQNNIYIDSIRTDLTDIMLLNMQAIQRKSSVAERTASESTFWIMLAGTICFMIAFVLFVNLPGNIANPVKELTESIKAIASQNYTQQVHFEKHNEFGELAMSFNTMAQKLQEYKTSNIEKLMMEKKRIETLINNMNDPVIGLDETNKILFMNDMAIKITGLSHENVIGRPMSAIASNNDLVRSLFNNVTNNKENNTGIKNPPLKIYADNKESYFDKEIIPIKIRPTGESEEKLIGNVILLQNITPFKELEFAKTNFIATISHELKTPISSIQMSIQLLENQQTGVINNEQKNLLKGIKDDAERLLKITAELLNMTQAESGNIQLNLSVINAREIFDYAINANRMAAEEKNIRLELTLPGDLPALAADKEKTAWVLTNLISNAIRYSYENTTIFLRAGLTTEGKMKLEVTDTGQGIAPEYKDKIFNRYFRIPGTKKEGTGLGLSISKEFIEAQGGKISVNSEYGAGSTFTIILNTAL